MKTQLDLVEQGDKMREIMGQTRSEMRLVMRLCLQFKLSGRILDEQSHVRRRLFYF